MDETYIKVKGVWKYLYRAVDKEGKTVDFLLTARRDKAAALRFFEKAMKANGVPGKVAMDKSGANKAAMNEINARGESQIVIRQVKYLNNLVEQDHRVHQTCHQLEAELQVISDRQKYLGWHRIDAHDSQRSAHARGLH